MMKVERAPCACLWCGAPASFQSEAVITLELLESVENKTIKGSAHEIRHFLSLEGERISFNACHPCLIRRHRRRIAGQLALAIYLCLIAGGGGWMVSFLLIRNIHPAWNLPPVLDWYIGSSVAVGVLAPGIWVVLGNAANLRKNNPLEWAALLAKRTLQKELREDDTKAWKAASGNARIVVYAPKEYENAIKTGRKPG